jgi:hypothetical protein
MGGGGALCGEEQFSLSINNGLAPLESDENRVSCIFSPCVGFSAAVKQQPKSPRGSGKFTKGEAEKDLLMGVSNPAIKKKNWTS